MQVIADIVGASCLHLVRSPCGHIRNVTISAPGNFNETNEAFGLELDALSEPSFPGGVLVLQTVVTLSHKDFTQML